MAIRSFRFVCLVLGLLAMLHAKAREIPQPKNNSNESQNKEVEVVAPNESPTITNTIVETNLKTIDPAAKDTPKEGHRHDDLNGDEKNFISFAGVGAAGGIGGVAGVMPFGWGGLDKGFGTIPTFGGVDGTGGGGLGGSGADGGRPPSIASGGLVPIP